MTAPALAPSHGERPLAIASRRVVRKDGEAPLIPAAAIAGALVPAFALCTHVAYDLGLSVALR